MKVFFVTSVLFVFFVTCRPSHDFYESETLKVRNCRSEWVYLELNKRIFLNVLFHQTKEYSKLTHYPNLVIGFTDDGDTIGIVDNQLEGKLEVGSKISAYSDDWVKDEKDAIPAFVVYPRKGMNELLCRVQFIYIGRINLE